MNIVIYSDKSIIIYDSSESEHGSESFIYLL